MDKHTTPKYPSEGRYSTTHVYEGDPGNNLFGSAPYSTIGIVDQEAGGIIAYASNENAVRIHDALHATEPVPTAETDFNVEYIDKDAIERLAKTLYEFYHGEDEWFNLDPTDPDDQPLRDNYLADALELAASMPHLFGIDEISEHNARALHWIADNNVRMPGE